MLYAWWVEGQRKNDDASSTGQDADRGRPGTGFEQAEGEEFSNRREPRRSLAERLFATLGESGDVLRRGHGLVTEVAQGTRDELARLVAAEVRGFLDRIDVVDLAQRILDGMSVEVRADLRFRRKGGEGAKMHVSFGGDREPETTSESNGAAEPPRSSDDKTNPRT